MNMSYCRFRNTLLALEDCFESWDEVGVQDKEELQAREQLKKLCKNITDELDS